MYRSCKTTLLSYFTQVWLNINGLGFCYWKLRSKIKKQSKQLSVPLELKIYHVILLLPFFSHNCKVLYHQTCQILHWICFQLTNKDWLVLSIIWSAVNKSDLLRIISSAIHLLVTSNIINVPPVHVKMLLNNNNLCLNNEYHSLVITGLIQLLVDSASSFSKYDVEGLTVFAVLH